MVVLTELRTTGSWLGVVRLTLSLTLLERLLQLVHPVLTLLSVWTTEVTMLLTTTSVPFGAITLTSSGMPTRLLRCTLDEPTAALSTAPVGVVNEYVWYNWHDPYLFTECLEELCAGWQSSGVPERLIWYLIYPGTFLELHLLCTIYYCL